MAPPRPPGRERPGSDALPPSHLQTVQDTGTRRYSGVIQSDLLACAMCITLHDMKTSALTIRLDAELERRLARAAERSGRTRSEFVRDALRRQLAVAQLDDLRRRIMPLAEAQGYLTDEDVFRDVS
jgi:predicted transcriptional regulator